LKSYNQNYKIFGRKKGRKPIKNLNNEILKKYLFNISTDFFTKKIILDIGSGNGENTLFLSQKYKNHLIVASEIYQDGNINLCKQLHNRKINNVKIFNQNVLLLLEEINLYNFIKEIWILFPDPWPKKKHNKRRLINFNFVNKISVLLEKNKKIFIVTDSVPYFISIIKSFYDSKSFKWVNDLPINWNYSLNIYHKTKYFEKTLKNNRKSFILIFQKI